MYNTLSNIVSSFGRFGHLISSCLSANYVQYFFFVNVESNFTNNILYYTVYLERLHSMHGNLIITTVKVNIMGILSNDQPAKTLSNLLFNNDRHKGLLYVQGAYVICLSLDSP